MTEHNYDVVVVSTWAEAIALGARGSGYRHVSPSGATFVSVAAGPRAIEGMRVGNIEITLKARQQHGFRQLLETLERSQARGLPR